MSNKQKGKHNGPGTKRTLVPAHGIELKAGHNYLIAIDSMKVEQSDMALIVSACRHTGIKAVIVAFKGDVESGLKVIEQKEQQDGIAS